MTLPQLRPRSATELVDAAIQLGRAHYRPLLVLSALVAIPNVVLGVLAQWTSPPATVTDPVEALAALGGTSLLAMVQLMWMAIGFGALVASVSAAYVDGSALEPAVALRRALARWWPLVAANVLAYLLVLVIVLVGLMLLAVVVGVVAGLAGVRGGSMTESPELLALIGTVFLVVFLVVVVGGGLLLWTRYVNIVAAVMLEGLGTMAALRRSAALVKGAWLRTAGLLAIMVVLYGVAFATSAALFALVFRDLNLSVNVAGVLTLALYPFLAAMLALLYYDLRIRREGYDLELMAQALDAPAGGSAAVGAEATI